MKRSLWKPFVSRSVPMMLGSCICNLIVLLSAPLASAQTTYYVATTGDDTTGTGASGNPFQTIQRAADLVNPGDTVIVRDGIYTTSDWGLIKANRGGNASGWVTFKAEHKWGAVLDGQNNATLYGFAPSASYLRVQDFEFRNFKYSAMAIDYSGNNYDISGNHIHEIGRFCSDGGDGYTGMFIHGITNVTVEKNVFHDIGRFGPGENGCSPTTTAYQNHDHAVYVDGANGLTIKNNIFYNIGHGWPIHFYSGDTSGPLRSSNILIANNTFAFPNPYRIGHILLALPGVDNTTIQNNIFYNPTTAAVNVSPDSTSFNNVVVSYNMVGGGVINSGSASGVTFANNTQNTDPQMVNPNSYDFHLQPTSPAKDAGAAISSITEDTDGDLRPQGSGWDIGADELLAAGPPPGGEEFTNDVNTIALYHFTGNYNDSSANGLNLSASGNVTLTSNPGWMQNPSGSAARFGDLGDQLVISTVPDSLVEPGPSPTPLSIEARIFVRGYKAYNRANASLISLYEDWDARLEVYDPIYPASGQPIGPTVVGYEWDVITSASQWQNAVSLNAWHKFKVTFAANGAANCYIDGSLVSSVTTSMYVPRSSAWAIRLGNFDGDIDEVRISNVVR